ncbi:MAG: class I SAM-dependent rRNA methyltransferase [Alphaproteobacteria bacterium]
MTAPDEPTDGTGAQGLPRLHILPKHGRRMRQGHPWLYSNELKLTADDKALPPGSPVNLVADDGHLYGTALFNARPLICARLIDRRPDVVPDRDWFARRFEAALNLRRRLVGRPYYRLIHAEADGLPGVIVDRYGDAAAVQINVAGFERLAEPLVEALRAVTGVATVVRRNDTPARAVEGLGGDDSVVGPVPTDAVAVEEGEARFFADLTTGQKTGWFYDQRDNRAFVATLCGGARMLDVYSHSGGFAIQAARAGAESVTAVDRSDHALALARRAAEDNGVAARCSFVKAEAFAELAALAERGARFDVVVCDPPAFAKSKKDLHAAVRGYHKLTRLAARLVAPGGFLFVASCSHNVPVDSFAAAVTAGIHDARRGGRILRQSGAAPDHPVHPHLPETAYLKAVTLQLD